MKLRTPLCDLLGIEYPVLQAAMGLVAYAPLAAAVSEAGGLGCVAATAMTPGQIRDEIRKVRSLTSRPFAVNVLLPENDMPFVPGYSVQEQVEVVLDERVPIWSTGLGSPKRWLAEAHRRGIKVISSVGTVRAGVAVAEAGVDAVVAQGQEAGGHVGTIGTFVLVPAGGRPDRRPGGFFHGGRRRRRHPDPAPAGAGRATAGGADHQPGDRRQAVQ